jgi:TRAP-type C4-dicarboxylate transport system permease small subunit
MKEFLPIKFLNFIIVAMFSCMSIAVFIQIIFRYLLHQPIYWSEEFPRFILIWLTFLGSAIAMKNRSHLSISLLTNRLSVKKRISVQFFANLLSLLFISILVWGGIIITILTMPNRTAALQMPTGLVYLAVPVGGILMIIYLLKNTIELFKKNNNKTKGKEEEKC